jgi:hypothetical protein
VEREEEVEYEWEKEERCLEARWERCEIGQEQFYNTSGEVRLQERKASGVPERALPKSLWKGWADDRQGSSHPNHRYLESLKHCYAGRPSDDEAPEDRFLCGVMVS